MDELTFCIGSEDYGERKMTDLKPNGRDIQVRVVLGSLTTQVTNETKREYVQLLAAHRMTTGIKEQVVSFLEGFHQMIPLDLISIFTPEELELLMCGMPEIDCAEMCQGGA